MIRDISLTGSLPILPLSLANPLVRMIDFLKWLGLLVCLFFVAASLPNNTAASPGEPSALYINRVDAGDVTTAHGISESMLSAILQDTPFPEIDIIHPDEGAVFPPNMAAPHFLWNDAFLFSNAWLVIIETRSKARVCCLTAEPCWIPQRKTWEWLCQHMGNEPATLTVVGFNATRTGRPISVTQRTFSISRDPFDGVLFFKQTPLPFLAAREHPEQSRWLLADIGAYDPPRVVVEGIQSCAHCHTFSRDGRFFGMDVDRKGDKGGYLLGPVAAQMTLDEQHFITWNAFRPEDGRTSMGLFTKISPCGRYLVSTVKETSLFAMLPDLAFSQLFFPVEGHLALYDQVEHRFQTLPGADRDDAVQTCPEWSPDGQTIAFARAPVDDVLVNLMRDQKFLTPARGETIYDLNRRYRIRFDLYTLAFNGGRGGIPTPLAGASRNGHSNYFPRYSPDGRWIAFTRSDTGLVLQPDSALYLVPASGGSARRMRCNTGRMNSWHCWSPNGRWLVFASKAVTPYTELLITHVDENGNDSPPVALNRLTREGFAAVLPEVIPSVGNNPLKIRIGTGFFAGTGP